MNGDPVASRAGPQLGLFRLLPKYAANRRLLLYVAVVVAVGPLLLFKAGGSAHGLLSVYFLAWLAICLAAEFLWLESVSGDGTDSMASTVNLSVIYLHASAPALWIIAISVFLATRFIQKRDWVKSFFGLGQMAVTAWVCVRVFAAIQPAPLDERVLREPATAVGMLAVGAAYFLVNTGLVALAISLELRAPFLATWRTNYGYRNSLVSSVALFALSPLLVLSFLALGYPGVVLFFLPLLIIKDQNREYIRLQKMTQALISSERMAAKGDMAAEVAHEINNYLQVLSGRTQLLLMRATRAGDEAMKGDAEIIRQQVSRMSALAKGLLDFSHKGVQLRAFDLDKLVVDTVDFVRPQNLFDRVELVTEVEAGAGEVQADPGQLQQVLINLLRNAAQAIREAAPSPEEIHGRIEVRTATGRKGTVRISVTDNGPGFSVESAAHVFEPGFTTKDDGHGYGLATCYRILQNHGGKITVQSEPGRGATFVLEFPRGMVVIEGKGATGSGVGDAAGGGGGATQAPRTPPPAPEGDAGEPTRATGTSPTEG
jgi:signal transduction histidine kinase